jgi:hypothetical protein
VCAGKTTTVEILEGLRTPDGGQAIVLGLDVASGTDSLKPRIGVSLHAALLLDSCAARSYLGRAAPGKRGTRGGVGADYASRAGPAMGDGGSDAARYSRLN